ncbi:hypothetical protein [Rhizobium sp. NXC14]|uniref:hypothetical protein n=1 Tax=Rhizobium sp. NXC14 TaxID=1981173 RepID=UPI000A26EC41|nr:hypothetical protein [Rhizobium sp. NXC14]
MYKPILLTEYKDGRRVFQFERPTSLRDISLETYYHVEIIDEHDDKIQEGILFISKEEKDILGNITPNTVFFVTDRTGGLPSCVYLDGRCVVIKQPLSSEEVEAEGAIFREALGIGRD